MRQNRPKNKSYKKDKEGHYTMIKGLIQDKDTILVKTDALSSGAPTYVKQKLTNMKGEIYSHTIGSLTPYLYQWTDHSNRIKKQRP